MLFFERQYYFALLFFHTTHTCLVVVIPPHAQPFFIEQTKIVLCISITLYCRLFVPFTRFAVGLVLYPSLSCTTRQDGSALGRPCIVAFSNHTRAFP